MGANISTHEEKFPAHLVLFNDEIKNGSARYLTAALLAVSNDDKDYLALWLVMLELNNRVPDRII